MARRALIVGSGVADRVAAGLQGWAIERAPGGTGPLELVVWADYPAAAAEPALLVDLSLDEWNERCDVPLRGAIDLARDAHHRLASASGTIVFLVPLMASAGGDRFAALAALGEGVRVLAKSLAKTWGGDDITAHAVTLDPHAFLDAADAAGIASANALHDHPLGRVPSDTVDVAPIIEWLSTDPAAPWTGGSLVVDGGLWMPG